MQLYEVMTPHVLTVTEADPLRDVAPLMERRRIRRVPVVRPIGWRGPFHLRVPPLLPGRARRRLLA